MNSENRMDGGKPGGLNRKRVDGQVNRENWVETGELREQER